LVVLGQELSVSEATPIDSLVERIIQGSAPSHVRAAAARGALPLPRAALVRLYVVLREDKDESIRLSAEASLKALGAEEIHAVLADAACTPEVLGHFAPKAARDERLAEKIAFHGAVPLQALIALATNGSAPVIELVLTNQEKLLEQPRLLERLMINPALRADQRSRILELLAWASKLAEERAAAGADEDHDGEPVDVEEAARLLEVDVGALMSASEILGAEELEQSEDPKIRSAFATIVTLNAAQKGILAMKGGREKRLILVRDTNKVVALGVLKNPRLSEQEVESIARMRNVTDEVLRGVGSNRDWTKNYAVILALVSNPRTPQGISANFIPRLTNRDLKSLIKSRDVPELIRRNAKRTHETRTQRQNKSFRKK
jgi:hypothetical protein